MFAIFSALIPAHSISKHTRKTIFWPTLTITLKEITPPGDREVWEEMRT